MSDVLYGIHMESRHGTADEWYGYWETRHEALQYLTTEAAGIGQPGELASFHADWLSAQPIEWVDGRDVNLVAKNRPWADHSDAESNAGGDCEA